MKILVCGTFCSGKTTLATQLSERLATSTLVADHCREVLEVYPHVDWRRPEIRDYALVRQLLLEAMVSDTSDPVVVDSGIVGNLAHDRALLANPPPRLPLIEQFDHRPYDVVLYCDPSDVPLSDDGQRFTEPALRRRVDREVCDVVEQLGYRYVATMRGSPRVRLDAALAQIPDQR